jgi:hypothetical protein
MVATTLPLNASSSDQLHAQFMAIVPKIETHAGFYFREVKCSNKKADKVAETVALAWRWYLRLCQRGKDVNQFVMVFVFLAARAVRAGRRLDGQEKSKDVMSSKAQQRWGFQVESLPASTAASHDSLMGSVAGQRQQDAWEERLIDNTLTPVPDQAAFRIDFPAWLQSLTARERRLIHAMLLNERTQDLGKAFELSPGRISQMRREFHQDWLRFHGESPVQPVQPESTSDCLPAPISSWQVDQQSTTVDQSIAAVY